MNYYTYSGNLRDRNKFTSTVNTTYGHRRYFSSLDTEFYFGQEQIDEMFQLEFLISEPKLPIYGYNSFYANRIVAGRRTIQGTFAINFTHANYMIGVLSRIDDSILSNKYESIVRRCEGEDSTGLGLGNSSIFDKMFDITISYGYAKTDGLQTYNCSYQTLVGVQIVEYRQALDADGNPILDMYTFIAKDIRYEVTREESPETPEASIPSGEEALTYHVDLKYKEIGGSRMLDLSISNDGKEGETFKDIIITIESIGRTMKDLTSMKTSKEGVAQGFIDLNGAEYRNIAAELDKYYKEANKSPTYVVEFITEDGTKRTSEAGKELLKITD
jgi:hypothetical protein